MRMSSIIGAALGFIAGAAAGSLVEHKVHKDVLHGSRELRDKFSFIENASRGHNDIHHCAFRSPAHYYRDITNENEIIHFAGSDVRLIEGGAFILGTLTDLVYHVTTLNPSFGWEDLAFTLGFTAGAEVYYRAYEFTHHYMHVIGERRLAINRALGDTIQGGIERRDGNLRFSKPLLDDVCTEIERRIDRRFAGKKGFNEIYPTSILKRLNEQVAYNAISGNANIGIYLYECTSALCTTAENVFEFDANYRSGLSGAQKAKYFLERRIQRTLRNSPIFVRQDNNHFGHHIQWGKNLGVVSYFWDYVLGTKADSSREILEENKRYWLCPNSPDVEQFKVKAREMVESIA